MTAYIEETMVPTNLDLEAAARDVARYQELLARIDADIAAAQEEAHEAFARGDQAGIARAWARRDDLVAEGGDYRNRLALLAGEVRALGQEEVDAYLAGVAVAQRQAAERRRARIVAVQASIAQFLAAIGALEADPAAANEDRGALEQERLALAARWGELAPLVGVDLPGSAAIAQTQLTPAERDAAVRGLAAWLVPMVEAARRADGALPLGVARIASAQTGRPEPTIRPPFVAGGR